MDSIIGGGQLGSGSLLSEGSITATTATSTLIGLGTQQLLETTATTTLTTDDETEPNEGDDEDDIAFAAEAAANALEGADAAVAKFTTGGVGGEGGGDSDDHDDDDVVASFVVDHHHHPHNDVDDDVVTGHLGLSLPTLTNPPLHQQLHHLLGAPTIGPPPPPISPPSVPTIEVRGTNNPVGLIRPLPQVQLVFAVTPAGPCRICGQPPPSSSSTMTTTPDSSNNNNRPMIRFFPIPAGAISSAVIKAAPSVTTFGQDICLHVFCGKTAGFLPGRSDPGLEIMTKAGLKNKHGIGQEVNAALARTRCGVPVLTHQQMQEQQRLLLEQQQEQEPLGVGGGGDFDNASGQAASSATTTTASSATTTTATSLLPGVTTTTTMGGGGMGIRSAASAAVAAAKDRQFYLVREFEAHLAAIRNKTISFGQHYERNMGNPTKSRSTTTPLVAATATRLASSRTVQQNQHQPHRQHHPHKQQQRLPIHGLDAHLHLTSSIPIVLPPPVTGVVGGATAMPPPSSAGTNPGPPLPPTPLLTYYSMYQYGLMNDGSNGATAGAPVAVASAAVTTNPFQHLEQHYAAVGSSTSSSATSTNNPEEGTSLQSQLLYNMHFPYPQYHHQQQQYHPLPHLMNNQQQQQQQQQQQPFGSVNGMGSGNMSGGGRTLQGTSEAKTTATMTAATMAFPPYLQQTQTTGTSAATTPVAGQAIPTSAPVPFPGHQPLAPPPMVVGGGPFNAIPIPALGIVANTGQGQTATTTSSSTSLKGGEGNGTKRIQVVKAGKSVHKSSLRAKASSSSRVGKSRTSSDSGGRSVMNGTTTALTTTPSIAGLIGATTATNLGSGATATAVSENGVGNDDYDLVGVTARSTITPISSFITGVDDGKVRCDCGGTYACSDGTSRGVTSWRNHALTKRHQRWLENMGGGSSDCDISGNNGNAHNNMKTSSSSSQHSNGNGMIP